MVKYPGVPGVCPECGAKFSLHAALNDARSRQALGAALSFDRRLADPILVYVDLFSPAERAMRADKLCRVLTELADMMNSGNITQNSAIIPVTFEGWRAGLETVAEQRSKLQLPLNNHNYLKSVIANHYKRQQGVAEQKQEDAARNRPRKAQHSQQKNKTAYEHGVQSIRQQLTGEKPS